MRSTLKKAGLVVEDNGLSHQTWPELRSKERWKSWWDLPVFTFVRHPATWYRSYWAFKVINGWDVRSNKFDAKVNSPTFAGFCRNILEKTPAAASRHFQKFTEGTQQVGKFENIREDLIRILDIFGEHFDPQFIRNRPVENRAASLPRFRDQLAYDPGLLKRMMREDGWTFRTYGYDPEKF